MERAGGQDSAAIRLALRDDNGWGKVCHPRSPRRRWYRPVARACQEVRAKKFGECTEAIPLGDESCAIAWCEGKWKKLQRTRGLRLPDVAMMAALTEFRPAADEGTQFADCRSDEREGRPLDKR